jgi:hypothetical protein
MVNMLPNSVVYNSGWCTTPKYPIYYRLFYDGQYNTKVSVRIQDNTWCLIKTLCDRNAKTNQSDTI